MKLLNVLLEDDDVNPLFKKYEKFYLRMETFYRTPHGTFFFNFYPRSLNLINDEITQLEFVISINIDTEKEYEKFKLDDEMFDYMTSLLKKSIEGRIMETGDLYTTKDDLMRQQIKIMGFYVSLFKLHLGLHHYIDNQDWVRFTQPRTIGEIFSGENPYRLDQEKLPIFDHNLKSESDVEYDRYMTLYNAYDEGTINMVLKYDSQGKKEYVLPDNTHTEEDFHPVKYKLVGNPHIYIGIDSFTFDKSDNTIKPDLYSKMNLTYSNIQVDNPDVNKYEIIEYFKEKFKQFGLTVT